MLQTGFILAGTGIGIYILMSIFMLVYIGKNGLQAISLQNFQRLFKYLWPIDVLSKGLIAFGVLLVFYDLVS